MRTDNGGYLENACTYVGAISINNRNTVHVLYKLFGTTEQVSKKVLLHDLQFITELLNYTGITNITMTISLNNTMRCATATISTVNRFCI